MKTLFVVFSRPVSKFTPYAEIIMAVDKTNYDHASIEFPGVEWGVSFFYQSSGEKTNFMGDACFNKKNLIVEKYSVDIDDDTYNKVGNICVNREGLPYGLVEVIGKALVVLAFLAFKKRIKNPFKSADTDCITEVAYVLANGLGIETPLDIESSTVKPFRDWIASLPNMKRIA